MKVSKVLQLLETDISLKEPHVSRTPDRAETTQGCCIPASGDMWHQSHVGLEGLCLHLSVSMIGTNAAIMGPPQGHTLTVWGCLFLQQC